MSGNFNHSDARVRRRVRSLWEDAGKPGGRDAEFVDRAEELVAIEDNQTATTPPVREGDRSEAEPREAIENQGEFPNLTDQGGDDGQSRARRNGD